MRGLYTSICIVAFWACASAQAGVVYFFQGAPSSVAPGGTVTVGVGLRFDGSDVAMLENEGGLAAAAVGISVTNGTLDSIVANDVPDGSVAQFDAYATWADTGTGSLYLWAGLTEGVKGPGPYPLSGATQEIILGTFSFTAGLSGTVTINGADIDGSDDTFTWANVLAETPVILDGGIGSAQLQVPISEAIPAVPLPPAAWSGVAMLFGLGAVRMWRRR